MRKVISPCLKCKVNEENLNVIRTAENIMRLLKLTVRLKGAYVQT